MATGLVVVEFDWRHSIPRPQKPRYTQRSPGYLLYTVFRKNTHSHFLSYLRELFVDLNKNCSEYTQGMVDSDNVEIRYSLRLMT